MGPFATGILVPLGLFAMIFGIVYMAITSRNRERMALIERGADPLLFEAKKRASNGSGTMKWGLLLFGIGIGVVIANLLVSSHAMDKDSAYPAMIFIFGGLALIVFYLWQSKQNKEEKLKE